MSFTRTIAFCHANKSRCPAICPPTCNQRLAASDFHPQSFGNFVLHQFHHDCLLRMKPVLCLLEHYRVHGINHLSGYFFAAMCGEAMHENRVRLRPAEQSSIHLVWMEYLVALGLFAFLAHAGPNV